MRKRDPVLITLGQNVRKRREVMGLTQEELSDKADLDQTYISGIERGLRNPGIINIAKLAKALKISVAELCKGIDE